MLTNNQMGQPVNSEEVRSIYVDDTDRFIVALVAGYNEGDTVTSAEQAAAAALALTLDHGSDGTVWFVFDRETGEHHVFDQGEVQETAWGMV